MNLNNVTLIGHVTMDPFSHEFDQGKRLTRFNLATNRRFRSKSGQAGKEETEFHTVVTFGTLAKICADYIKRGRLVYVQGRLKTSRWQDDQKNLRSKTEIVANQMLLLDRKQASVSAASVSGDDATEAVIQLTPELMQERATVPA